MDNFKYKGSQNIIPDAFSRIHMDKLMLDINSALHVNLDSPAFIEPSYLERIEKIKSNLDVIYNLKDNDGNLRISLSYDLRYFLLNVKLLLSQHG